MMEYEIHARHEDGWWMIDIPAIDGLTQARRLADVEAEAADYIMVDQDVPPSAVSVKVTSIVAGGHEFGGVLGDLVLVRAKAREAEAEAMSQARRVALELADSDVPVRDIGAAIGVSYQRAHQLVSGK
ncbi:HicB family toxin-antitoxin system [Flexivirga sp. ID2601S]|uniref:HicB family toxin-antitoxin system n=1 Tax=Flexivirga aerilata TaxID=1656889 RepID=A0A849AH77_9MICO|nr:HicB family toxin-antitoxin system [Flexivirga aerilata]NNG39805.1 HicB family toxin-antitoxin system [Flexivirga aerilata]